MTVANCQYCGVAVEVSDVDNENDFSGFLQRLKIKSAACQSCGEKNEGRLADERARMAEEDKRRREEFEEFERQKIPRAISGVVGRKYLECTLDTFRAASQGQRDALAAAKEFSSSPSGFLFLHGKPGVGKTHLAVGIFRDHAKTLRSRYREGMPERDRDYFSEADFWTVPELLLHLRSQIGNDVGEEEAIAPLLKSKLLILDDLGAEKMTDWVRQAFYVVISRRERDELPTVITSNLSLGEIEARIGDERITSRIGGAAKIIRMDGQDGRLASRKTAKSEGGGR
ncbi:MAG: ATP-binding protein [Hyphomicrobium sp.]|jgi:DNA replication protein DnaC